VKKKQKNKLYLREGEGEGREEHEKEQSAPAAAAKHGAARTSSTTLSQMTGVRFSDQPIHALTKRGISEALGYVTMTRVQEQTLPVALNGDDLLAKAKTGTGKTLSFLIPAVEAAVRASSPGFVQILCVSPTRELASQIYEEAALLCRFHADMRLMCIFGGTSMNKDISGFRTPPNLLVATPGRLNDHLENSGLASIMSRLRILILDEADQLLGTQFTCFTSTKVQIVTPFEFLDMGFRPAITAMLAKLPPKSTRQTLLFSATMPKDVRAIAELSMRARMQQAPFTGFFRHILVLFFTILALC
jgi:ATP-dependent RNA helicase MSS116